MKEDVSSAAYSGLSLVRCPICSQTLFTAMGREGKPEWICGCNHPELFNYNVENQRRSQAAEHQRKLAEKSDKARRDAILQPWIKWASHAETDGSGPGEMEVGPPGEALHEPSPTVAQEEDDYIDQLLSWAGRIRRRGESPHNVF